VENEADILHHVLKMQYISLLHKQIQWIAACANSSVTSVQAAHMCQGNEFLLVVTLLHVYCQPHLLALSKIELRMNIHFICQLSKELPHLHYLPTGSCPANSSSVGECGI